MRRKPGELFPIELSVLAAGIDLACAGELEFHGYAIARVIAELVEARRLTAHGTLYRALDRLEEAGLLESRLEDAETAAGESRPRRHLYRVTALGESAYAAVVPEANHRRAALRPGTAPS